MARLTKFDVEALLGGYDTNPIDALTRALAKVLDRPGASWTDLLAVAPLTAEARTALRAGETAALDDLARLLNEMRDLPPRP
jgi:hypothetical protein